ncbi:MAG: Dienelactone hydrolase [Chloroflexi bacterium]|nr:MAG: Dienelactone hydrolase [Chloroflexota bacterium]
MSNQPTDTTPLPLLRQFYAYDRDLPLEVETAPFGSADSQALRMERFEITSSHDERVPGLVLWDPRREGPRPVLLVAHPATLGKGDEYVLSPAHDWIARGAVCVTIDQAGHGERARRPITMEEFTRFPQRRAAMAIQTVVDWMRTLDYVVTRPEIDPRRIGFVGFSMGGMRGAPFVGLDARVGAAVFCISGAAKGRPTDHAERLAQQITDPATFAPLMDRPTLVVAGERDDIVPPDAAQRFYDAMPEPREIAWGAYGHWDFMPQGLAPVWPFLERHLFD